MAETRRFKMHPKLLLDVIKKQAGSLAKAILEGAMNAVDAGATRFDITVDEETVMMEDDGKGFTSREEVETFFEVFGQPHTEGDAHYGQFRMGRGQIFSYGHNFWRTGSWAMTVDIQENGLEYRLEDMKKEVPGCQILVSLYTKLSRLQMQDTRQVVGRFVKYLEIPVYWHEDKVEEKISVDPRTQKWDHKDPNCYIKFKETGSLDVYNMGVHVKTYDRWAFGTGGVVVSREPLEVNFARNDIQSTCAVWQKIRKLVDVRAKARIRTRPLDDAARQNLAMSLHNTGGEVPPFRDVGQQRIVTDCCGKHITLQSLVDKIRKMPISVSPRGARLGDRVMQTGIAYVLAQETLDRFGVGTVTQLCNLISKAGGPLDLRPDYRPLDKLAEKIMTDTTIIPDKDLRPRERMWLRLMRRFPQGYRQFDSLTFDEAKTLGYDKARVFKIGVSDGVNGWTDGRTYIAIERSLLEYLSYSRIGDVVSLGHVILHEICHTADSQEVSDHDPEFYERFHDYRHLVSDFVTQVFNNLERDIKEEMKRTNKDLNVLLDRRDANILTEEAFNDLSALVHAARGHKHVKLDLSHVEAKLVAAEAIRKKPKKKPRKVADLGFLDKT